MLETIHTHRKRPPLAQSTYNLMQDKDAANGSHKKNGMSGEGRLKVTDLNEQAVSTMSLVPKLPVAVGCMEYVVLGEWV